MIGFLFKRLLLPIILYFVIGVLSELLMPEEYAALQTLPTIIFVIGVIYWWLTGLARWLVRRWHWVMVGYLLTNAAVAFVIVGAGLVGSMLLAQNYPTWAGGVWLVGLVGGAGWFIGSIVQLLRKGQRRRNKSPFWRTISKWMDQGPTTPTKKAPAAKAQRAPKSPAAKPASKPIYTPVGAGGQSTRGQSAGGVAIPPRATTPRMVTNDAQDFVQQAQAWATRQEYVGNYAPFDATYPTYRKMTFEQQQWYFYWRTQLRQGNLLATDLSYLFVYLYELLNLVGVNSPTDARDRLVSFWQSYRTLQPKLDTYVVDWVADFHMLHNLPNSVVTWYADLLRAGVTTRNSEALQLEAWHQQGHNYEAIPAPTLFALANYATQQNKFYQAYQQEMALDEALKRGVAVIDEHIQQTQQISLYELYLPTPTQTVMRPPLLGALHTYPTTPLVIGHVRPWLSDETLQEDLKGILRYTENILRTQAAFKTKLRGVTLTPAWAAILDQAFAIVLPKRVVNIDMAGAAALQQESDELRQRLLEADEASAEDEPITPAQPVTPVVTPLITNAAPPAPSPLQRPADAPDGELTDLPAIAAIMGDAGSADAELLRHLRSLEWQAKPNQLKVGNGSQFVNVIFDRINERALDQVGDALLFVEGDEWVVGEDYRDELAYLLDHPVYTTTLASNTSSTPKVSVGDGATSSPVDPVAASTLDSARGDQHDLIPSGWEECVLKMQPLNWATLAIVTEQPGPNVMPALGALARSHYVTANQLLDQVNEIGLATAGDNLINVAASPPQGIEEYLEAIRALLIWAKEHDQIETGQTAIDQPEAEQTGQESSQL